MSTSQRVDIPQGDDELERLVREEQVQTLYSKGLAALLTNLITSAILVSVLWREVPRAASVGWLGTMVAVVAVRLLLYRDHENSRGEPYDLRRWERIWVIGACVTGAVWGSAALVLFPSEFPAGQYILLLVIGGMVAGASASMSSYFPAFLAFTVPALLPYVARLLVEDTVVHWAMALLIGTFGVGMASLASMSSRALAGSTRLRSRNAGLLKELMAMRAQLTELNRELEERVAARTRELEQAFADRDNFVSVVSHELRTPLQSMKLARGMLERVLESPAPDADQIRKLLALLARPTDDMQRTVDDLLDVGRLSTERMRYTMVPIDLKSIVVGAVEQMRPLLASARVEFDVQCEEGIWVDWDAHRIGQVLVNLMSNALKYGKPPFVVKARRIDGKAGIVVQDHGKGIRPEDLHRVFSIFERAGADGAGHGLGLYIADRIVRAHRGTIRVESAPGRGTAFIVELPLRVTQARTRLQEEAPRA